MRIILKGFSEKKEEYSDYYSINAEKLDVNIKGFDDKNAKTARDDELLKSLWNLYLNDETTWAVVQSISMLTLGEKFEIEGVPKDSTEYEDLTRAFNRAWLSLFDIVRNTLVFGNAYAKIVKNRVGKFYNLEVLHSLEVTKELKNDKAIYYYNKKSYDESEIFENVFFPRPDSIYGIPLLAPAKGAIERKRSLERNIATAIERHMPRFHVTVKPDPKTQLYPDDDTRRKIGREFRKLTADNEFVTTDLVGINVIDTKSTIPQLEDYTSFTLNSILIGTNVPAEIVGAITSSGTYASSKAKVNTFLSFVLPYYQNILQFTINSKILKDSNAKIKILRPESLALPYSK